MKYVKLTAKPDTWFKEGTEVYSDNCNPPHQLQRVTLEEWESCVNFTGIKGILVCGIRVSKYNNEIKLFGKSERWDGEFCWIGEFDVEIVDEAF